MGTTVSAELVDHGERRDQIGRVHMPEARQRELVAAFRQSGLTRRVFARREGVRYTTFCTWVQRDERKQALRAAEPPKRQAMPAGEPKRIRFAEVALPSGVRGGLEVRLPDGTTMRGESVEDLAALVRALRS